MLMRGRKNAYKIGKRKGKRNFGKLQLSRKEFKNCYPANYIKVRHIVLSNCPSQWTKTKLRSF